MENKSTVATILLLFGCIVGIGYLIGFWSTFNLNVFQYANVTDILKATILPVSLIFLSCAFSYFGWGAQRFASPPVAPPPPGSRRAKIGERFLRWKFAIVTAWGGALVNIFTFAPAPWKWYAISVMAIPLGIALSYTTPFTNLIPNGKLRDAATFFFSCLPFLAIAGGSNEATEITKGRSKYIVTVNLQIPKISSQEAEHLEYIGFVGNSFFLYEPTSKRLIILKQSDSLIVTLTPNPSLTK